MDRLVAANRAQNIVEVKCVTWSKDSHNLFDYESQNIFVKKYRVDTPFRIVRANNEVIIVDQDKKIDDETIEDLTDITKDTNYDYFINGNKNALAENEVTRPEQEVFLIVRSLKNANQEQTGYQLRLNDLVKLGRIEYQVVEVQDENLNRQYSREIFCSKEQYDFNIDFTSNDKFSCRICLSEERQTEEDPLISPCACKGFQKYIHFKCLKKWIETKISKKLNGNAVSYKWKQMECEVCKSHLPKSISVNGQQTFFVDVERPQCAYIILECISREKNVSKGMYLIHSLSEDGAKLGRGHQCDIRISDISVSRLHAHIRYIDGQFVIQDNNSKFGTLVQLRNAFQIQREKVAIQIGRTVLTFVLKNMEEMVLQENLKTQKLAQQQQLQQQQQSQQPQQQQQQQQQPGQSEIRSEQSNSAKTVTSSSTIRDFMAPVMKR